MDYDWNMISSIATAISAIIGAIGVVFMAWQFYIGKKQDQASFEDSIVVQYRELSMNLPVDILIGEEVKENERGIVRELIYNYLDLSNEQVLYRAKGRISKQTWRCWSLGIKAHMERPAFKEVFEEVKSAAGFTYLSRLNDCAFSEDPKNWY
jgi:hypothetical protein